MPHPTPVQIAYGSATVISSTFLLLFLAPTGSALAVWLIAVFALMLGVVVAIACQSRRDAGQPATRVGEPAHDSTHTAAHASASEAPREPAQGYHRVPAQASAQAAGSPPEVALRGR